MQLSTEDRLRLADHLLASVGTAAGIDDTAWDRKIEQHANNGQLDELGSEALADFNSARLRDL